MQSVIITAPSLDPTQNVSGVSSVAMFIIENNREWEYHHFQLGKPDKERGLLTRVMRVLNSYKEWKRFIDEREDAIIHYSFPLSAPSILRDPWFMNYALKRNRKMVVHIHGGLFLTAPKIPFYLNVLLMWVFSWDVPFIVLSEMEKEILQRRFGAKRVEVLANCPQMPQTPSSPPLSPQGERSCLTLGYLGRIEPNKGMTELLEACWKLKREGVKFKLRFAGKEAKEGEYLPLFEKLNEDGEFFEYVGLVSGEQKDEFLKSLDVFVMPTYFEGLPMSLLECMAYGAVPVVTNVGSISDVMHDDVNGVFIATKDVDSIVAAIKRLDNNCTLLHRLSVSAVDTINSNFSPKKYVKQLNGIYDSLG